MTSDRIKEIQETTAYPESISVKQALLQVWNECEQEQRLNAGKWISVDERLPEIGVSCLMYCERYDLVASARFEGDIFMFGGASYKIGDEVTDWQPLPLPPNHTEQKNKG